MSSEPSTSGQRHAPGPHDRVLARDVAATVIPAGEPAILPAGTKVTITHRLGGNFTVVCDTGMFRINGTDADALGEQAPTEATSGTGTTDVNGSRGTAEHPGHSGPPAEDALWKQLKTVFDPEIPVNIVDLGLIYSMEMKKTDGGGRRVEVKMTLTAQGCGMGPSIAADARQKILSLEGIQEAQVDVVWDPPWGPQMITPDGRKKLGMD